MTMKFYSLQLRIILLFILSFSISHDILSFPINFAVPASGEGLKKLKTWDPIRKYLEENIDLNINLIIAQDHSIIKDNLENKNYDFAVIDSFWFENWKENRICDPFLEVQKINYTNIKSLLIVHRDSIFRSLVDLQNSSLALTLQKDSSYGFYIPLALMLEYGIDPFSYFKEIIFPETFESILKAISYGKFDSGFISSNLLSNPQLKQYTENIRVIMESETMPGSYIIVRRDFNETILLKIKNLLTDLANNEDGHNLLNNVGLIGFVEPLNIESYQPKEYLNILENNNASPE